MNFFQKAYFLYIYMDVERERDEELFITNDRILFVYKTIINAPINVVFALFFMLR